jgi:transcriptional regulator with GAF, ATPase, and Fis domain
MSSQWRALDDDVAPAQAPTAFGYVRQEPTRRFVNRLSLDRALSVLSRSVLRIFDATVVNIYLTDQAGLLSRRRFTARSPEDFHWESIDATERPPGFSDAVLDRAQPLFSDDPPSLVAEWVSETPRPTLTASVPLQFEKRDHGLLHLTREGSTPLSPAERERLTLLAPYGAVAIENARLHAQEVEAARLDGVRLAARTAADQVGNDIAIVIWMADIARRQLTNGEPVDPHFLEEIVLGASHGIHTLQKILDVAKVETVRVGQLPPILDLTNVRFPGE